jgi:DNA-binding NtrC family response regulator
MKMKARVERILVVDDDERILESISGYLVLKGFEVEGAKTAAEALKKLPNSDLDLAILDIRLTDMDGTELLSKIHEIKPSMVKIMLTGYPDADNAVRSLNNGADAYLVKPVTSEELEKLVREKLEERKAESELHGERLVDYIESRDKEFSERDS